MDIKIRKATREDMDWINSRYEEVKFQPSDFDKEIIAIAEAGGSRAGLGRLVEISEDCLELGGMLVLEEYRYLGLAKKIIEFLLDHSEGKKIYCIPFAHLYKLYNSFGFSLCDDLSKISRPVIDKYNWCKKVYEHEVLLLVK